MKKKLYKPSKLHFYKIPLTVFEEIILYYRERVTDHRRSKNTVILTKQNHFTNHLFAPKDLRLYIE